MSGKSVDDTSDQAIERAVRRLRLYQGASDTLFYPEDEPGIFSHDKSGRLVSFHVPLRNTSALHNENNVVNYTAEPVPRYVPVRQRLLDELQAQELILSDRISSDGLDWVKEQLRRRLVELQGIFGGNDPDDDQQETSAKMISPGESLEPSLEPGLHERLEQGEPEQYPDTIAKTEHDTRVTSGVYSPGIAMPDLTKLSKRPKGFAQSLLELDAATDEDFPGKAVETDNQSLILLSNENSEAATSAIPQHDTPRKTGGKAPASSGKRAKRGPTTKEEQALTDLKKALKEEWTPHVSTSRTDSVDSEGASRTEATSSTTVRRGAPHRSKRGGDANKRERDHANIDHARLLKEAERASQVTGGSVLASEEDAAGERDDLTSETALTATTPTKSNNTVIKRPSATTAATKGPGGRRVIPRRAKSSTQSGGPSTVYLTSRVPAHIRQAAKDADEETRTRLNSVFNSGKTGSDLYSMLSESSTQVKDVVAKSGGYESFSAARLALSGPVEVVTVNFTDLLQSLASQLRDKDTGDDDE